MLIQDIKPPIQKAIHTTAKNTARQYRRVKLFVTGSKYGLPVMIVIIAIFGATIVAAIPNDRRSTVFYPGEVKSDSWDNLDEIYELDLGKNANISDFNNLI